MSNSHRKRKGRATPAAPANQPRQRKAKTPLEQAPAPTSQALPPIEVPRIGPPRRKPTRTTQDERAALPPGALASLHVSGGMAFSQRELVVYDDGRATYAMAGQGRSQPQQSFHLSGEQLSAVRAALAALDARAFAGRRASPSPDAYTYEIAARVAGEPAATTASTAFIPPQLAPLLRLLRDLVPDSQT